MRQESTEIRVQEYLSQAHLIHRGGLVMLERLVYMKTRRRAMKLENRNNPTIMSVIFGKYLRYMH
jgi:hypothetical protein